MRHLLGCPKEADDRNETCDCARLREQGIKCPECASEERYLGFQGISCKTCGKQW